MQCFRTDPLPIYFQEVLWRTKLDNLKENENFASTPNMAAIIHKVLFSWFMVLVFLTFLVLRLDEKVSWNWFIVFVPMWFFDAIMLVYVIFHMIAHCRNIGTRQGARNDQTMARKVWYLGAVALKLLFQVLLCLRLQEYADLNSYIIVTPLWILFLVMTGDISKILFTKSRGPSSSFAIQRSHAIRNPPRTSERDSF